MAKTTEKWEPSNLLALAIGVLEEQQGGSLKKYGTSEHLAIVRYLIAEICRAAKVPLAPEQEAAIKKEFAENSDFLAYASNAKKKLEAVGLLSEIKTVEEYK